MEKISAVRIAATGMHVPEKTVTNKDLEGLMDTSDEWIRQRSGIGERRQVESGTGPSDLALLATQKALATAGLTAQDIDFVIVATLSPDYYFPGTSCFLQDYLELGTKPSLDVRAQCTGFLYGLDIGKSYVALGKYKRVLVCGAEVHSAAIDYSTPGRDVSVLFGDGAGCVILEPCENDRRGIHKINLHSQGAFRDQLKIEKPGTRDRPYIRPEDLEARKQFPYMEGKVVFKHAVQRMHEAVLETLKEHKMAPGDVDLFLFHQANKRINETVLKMLGVPPEKTYNNIEKYGNCSAASIPMLLDECVRSGRIHAGSKVVLAAFGAGFTWGATLIDWD